MHGAAMCVAVERCGLERWQWQIGGSVHLYVRMGCHPGKNSASYLATARRPDNQLRILSHEVCGKQCLCALVAAGPAAAVRTHGGLWPSAARTALVRACCCMLLYRARGVRGRNRMKHALIVSGDLRRYAAVPGGVTCTG
jgi:hypothetical protein